MARGRRGQGTFDDYQLVDEEVERLLSVSFENREAARLARNANARIRELLKENHDDAINNDQSGALSGWVICGNFRFRPRAADRPEKKIPAKTRKAGTDWAPLEIELRSPS